MKCERDGRIHYCDGRDRRICAMDFWVFGIVAFCGGAILGALTATYIWNEHFCGPYTNKPALELHSGSASGAEK